jgi:YD repeat-containing protein
MTDFVYDARGRVTAKKSWINGAWQTTTFTYDSFGRTASVQRPDGQTRNFEYDAAWRLIREYELESPGVYAQKRYAYNNLSQVTRIDVERSAAPVKSPALSAPSTDADGAFTVSWSAFSDAVSYRLEESVNSGAWAQIADTAATSRTLSGKANGTYSYRVKACNAAGCGPLSNTGTTVVSLSGPPATPTLTAPHAENFTGTFQIAWGAITGAASYRVEESTNGGAWIQIFDTTATSVTRSRVSGEYSYRTRACNAAGCSTYSAVRTVYVDKGDSCPGCLMNAPAPAEVQSTASDSEGGEA